MLFFLDVLTMSTARKRIKYLSDLYHNPSSNLFLNANKSDILSEAEGDGILLGISNNEIEIFKKSLENISKEKEFSLLQGKKRYGSRTFYAFSPGNILLADLAFLRPIRATEQNKYAIICVTIDAFSRFVQCFPQQSRNSKDTLNSLQKAIENSGKTTYTKLGVDRGMKQRERERERERVGVRGDTYYPITAHLDD